MQVDLIRGGTTYSLSDGVYCYFYGVDGAGVSPLHRLRERGPLQHGETDVGFRLDPRTLTLALAMPAMTYSTYWDMRAALCSIVLSTSEADALTLRFTLDNGNVRSIDCHYVGGISMATSEEALARLQKIPAMFSAGDPTFYDPTAGVLTWTIADYGGLLFSTIFPIVFGSTSISVADSVTYTGTWISYPTFTLTGPMDNPQIVNVSTNERINLAYSIPAGTVVTIDLSFAAKTIKDQTGLNLIGYLTSDSDLATFHLAPAPEVAGGINVINVSATGATAATAIQMTYYNRYIGI